ncbi:hypothetical protein ACFQ3J_20320 [Paenibacillus provencensis]|uniref:Uncharacterized protein n=1 Tax=Paenibacillus provencensis TaxID=441151 RepID=A0ABW3Q0J1_9BACL|nr:hypothetical protein [Paenibacillus sp. MER 78]
MADALFCGTNLDLGLKCRGRNSPKTVLGYILISVTEYEKKKQS